MFVIESGMILSLKINKSQKCCGRVIVILILLYGKLRIRRDIADIMDSIGSTNFATWQSVNRTITEQIMTKIQPGIVQIL